MIVDCAVYTDGRRRDGTLSLAEAAEASRQDRSFVWIGLFEPSAEELERVDAELGLHELAKEDAGKGHQRPKVETYDDTLFVVLKTVRYVDPVEAIETGEIQLFVNPDFVVTIRHGEGTDLAAVRRGVEGRADLLAHGPTAVLHAVLDRVVDGYGPAADDLEADIEDVERQVFSDDRSNPAPRIYNLDREVLEFRRAVSPLETAVDRLARGGPLQDYFRDVHDHLLRVDERIEGFHNLLTSILQANLTQVSVRQNEDMRRISAWVAIIAVPTMIAGIYGMNFEHMPELRWRFGYPAVLLVIVIACTTLYRRFKRAGWL